MMDLTGAGYVIYEKATWRVIAAGGCEAGFECDHVTDPATQDYIPVAGDRVPDPNKVRVVAGQIVEIK